MPQQQPADPLHDLRERLQATQEAAQRLTGEAAAARAAKTPPAGWATEQERASMRRELEEVTALLRALRELLPAELQQQVAEVLKQVLLLVRALLDWWVARLDEVSERSARTAAPTRAAVQDIPIR